MKLLSYERNGESRVGVVNGAGVIDVGSRLGVPTLRALLEAGLLDQARTLLSEPVDEQLDDLTLLPLIADPAHFYCVGVNYAEHLQEVRDAGIERPRPKAPSLFIRFPESLTAHGQPMVMPKVSDEFDYEAELAVVIGKGGHYIAVGDALAHVAGYSCFNDGSVRDWQYHSSQVTSGKNFLRTGALGPCLVTPDDVGDVGDLAIRLSLNGDVLQDSNTRHMIFNVAEIISYASALVPLKAGDVIATGTPSGVGFSRKPPVFMKSGDVCVVEIEKVGVLRNPITKGS